MKNLKLIKKPKYKFFGKLSVITGILSIVLAGCVEDGVLDLSNADTETFNLPVKLAIPIAKGDITIREVVDRLDIEDFELKTFEDGLIYFDYYDTFDIADFIKVDVPDQSHQEMLINDGSIVPDIIPVFAGANFTISDSTKFTVELEGVELHQAVLNGGNFEIYANDVLEGVSGISQTLTVVIPEVSKDGVTFMRTFTNEDFGKRHSFNLSDFVMSTSGTGTDEYIRIMYTYTITNTTTSTVMVPAPDALYFEFAMTDIDPRYVTGFLGTREIYSGNSIVDVPIIDSKYVQDSTIFFKDPRLNVSLINPIGMPFNVNILSIRLINEEEEDSIDLETDESTFEVLSGTVSYPGSYQVEIEPYVFDYRFTTENSNLDELIGKVYDKVLLNYNVISNPNGKDPEKDNVVKFGRADVTVASYAEFPLWVKASHFIYEDTVAFDFEKEVLDSLEADVDTTVLDNVDSLKVILGINNKIPLDLNGQVYLADENYQLIDSVFMNVDDIVLHGAVVDADGVPVEAVESVIELTVSPEKRSKWRPGKYILFKADASSTDDDLDQFVRVYDTSGLEFYVGFEASGNVSNQVLDTIENQ